MCYEIIPSTTPKQVFIPRNGNIFVKADPIMFADSFKVYRHATDHDDGNQDSWFIVATMKTPTVDEATQKNWVLTDVTHFSTMEHGVTAERIGQIITRMITHGMNMTRWYHC